MTGYTRVPDGWWCALHGEVHLGRIDSWGMDHRTHLHPLFFAARPAGREVRDDD